MKKVPKTSVHYRESTGARKCGNCAMLHGNTRTLVSGYIMRDYVCDKWVKK